jgi:peptide/nickel transport system permease protein
VTLETTTDARESGALSMPNVFRATGLRRLWRRPSFGLAVVYLVLLVIVAIFAPLIAPYDPITQNLVNPLAPFSPQHLLGTDDLGRDVLSRLLWGARPTIIGALIAGLTTCVLGLPWGLVAGYAGGWTDIVLMRIADAVMVFPGIVLALALVSALGPSLVSTMFAIGLVYSPVLARVVRAGVLTVQYKDYVVVTRMYGLPAWHRIVHHVLPNVLPGAVVQLTLLLGITILIQTGLNFLGLGVPNPNPSWGSSVAETFQYIVVNPMAPLVPGLCIVVTILAIYRLGDELRDILDVDR